MLFRSEPEARTANERAILEQIDSFGGFDMHVDDMRSLYEGALTLQERGVVTISGRRGPGQMWVRVERSDEVVNG